MPRKFTYSDLTETINNTGIILLTTEEEFKTIYTTTKNSNIRCLYTCGHEKTCSWSNIQKRIVNKKNNCPDCANKDAAEKMREAHEKQLLTEFNKRNNLETNKKLCAYCNKWLHIDCFGKSKKTRDKKKNTCKDCHNKEGKERRDNSTGEHFITAAIAKAKDHHEGREKKGRQFKHPFNYDVDDINQHRNKNGKLICVFTGKEQFAQKMDDKSKQMSIDRKDNDDTYWKDKSGQTTDNNVQITSVRINIMKGELTDDEFLETIKEIAIYRLGMKLPNE
jgi:hypothetical protein